MTNWSPFPYLLKNIQGSYGSEAYGAAIGRGLCFGIGNTFWQKRFSATLAPLAEMSYNPPSFGDPLSKLVIANISAGLITNGPVAINTTLNIAAGINFVAAVGSDSTSAPDTMDYYDLTDPSQAVLLSKNSLPGGNVGNHKANANAIGQVLFAVNPATGTNYIFVINGNNGVAAYALSGGVTPPPKLLSQPNNLRILQGSSGTMGVTVDQVATVTWFKGTNPPVNTGISGLTFAINNAQLSSAGDYFVIASNANGSITSQVAHVAIGIANDNYSLAQAWAATPGNVNYPYVTADGGPNTPNERQFAYNALSNQLIVVRCPPASTAYTLWVVDGTTGTNLYTLNTTGIIHEGPSEVAGSNPIDLVGAAAADDGSIYICSESPNASGGSVGDTTKMFHLFRWSNSAASTLPTLVYEGDPSSQIVGVNLRWGDVLACRGAGANTELILNSQDGVYGALLRPTDATLTTFTNFGFFDSAGGGSIGRSIQFGPTNTVYEKRKGVSLVYSRYDTNTQSSLAIGSVPSSGTLGGVFVDSAHKLAVGVDFVGSPSKPDAVSVYEVSDPSSPLFINSYSFPANQVANANVICETIVSGSRVFALDANNGLMAFNIIPPVNSMVLHITPAGANVNLSWGNSEAILQGTASLQAPITWTDLAGPGLTSSSQSASGPYQYYRLIQRF
jgi:hypothetical protein